MSCPVNSHNELDRSRYFEAWASRSLFTEYLKAGARLSAAPRPRLPNSLFKDNFSLNYDRVPAEYGITELEPVFDAADMVRCGRDIFIQRSQVTNWLGVLWLQRPLGSS